jgi:N4-gp56 family major capsid protein
MADQQSTHASLSSAVNTYYEKTLLEDFEPNTHYYGLAPQKTEMPTGSGKTIEFTRYKKIAPKATDDASELANYQTYLSAEVVTASLRERSNYVQLSRFVTLTAISNPLDQAMKRVASAAVKTLDILVRNDIGMAVVDIATLSAVKMQNLNIDGGTLNHSGITARLWTIDAQTSGNARGFDFVHNKALLAQSSTVVSIAKSGMTFKTLQDAVNKLEGRDVPMINGNYNAIMHPTSIYQLTTSAGFKGWFSPTSSDAAKNSPASEGIVAGVKCHKSTKAFRFPLSGDTLATSSGAIFGTLLFGEEAYGTVSIQGEGQRQGFELNMKESGSQSTNDPNNKMKTAGYILYNAGKILNKEAGLWIITTEVV